MRPLNWLFGLSVLSQASSATVLPPPAGPDTQPLPPSEDPWYTAPPGFECKAPGTILRIRPAPGNLTTVINNASAAYHVLYRTTNARNRPSWAVTTLLTPTSPYTSPSGKAALLSYHLAYNAANLDSAPSIGLYWRMAQDDPFLEQKSYASFINDFLSKGWIVSSPDYLGPTSAFGASVQAGHATLDSVRAALSLKDLAGNVTSGINTAIWGYSGGSIAAGAAAEMKDQYAPELEIAGSVLGGLVDDLTADYDYLSESVIAGVMVSVLVGITAEYPEARAYLESRLVPETKDEFLSVREINVDDAAVIFSEKDIYAYFKGGAADLQAPVLRRVYDKQAKLGFRDVPKVPMFVYKAIGDQWCPVNQTDVTVGRWCDADTGADITYERNTVGEHMSEIDNGKPRVETWLGSIFDESYKSSVDGCTIRNVTVDLSTEAS